MAVQPRMRMTHLWDIHSTLWGCEGWQACGRFGQLPPMSYYRKVHTQPTQTSPDTDSRGDISQNHARQEQDRGGMG